MNPSPRDTEIEIRMIVTHALMGHPEVEPQAVDLIVDQCAKLVAPAQLPIPFMKTREELTEILGYLKSTRAVAQANVDAELRRPLYAIDSMAINRGNKEVAIIEAKIDLIEWVLS